MAAIGTKVDIVQYAYQALIVLFENITIHALQHVQHVWETRE
jgi:hypothetical protein